MNQANHKTTKPHLVNQNEPGLALPISEEIAIYLMGRLKIKTLERHQISLSQSEINIPTASGAQFINLILLGLVAPENRPSIAAGLAHMIRRAFKLEAQPRYQANERESIAMYCSDRLIK